MPGRDTLNFFDPNKDIPAHHENQLTRAFLVVLRTSPWAHQAWLSFAAPGRKLYDLPRPSFDTQKWRMFSSVPEATEPIQGISVLQSADVKEVEGAIQTSDRGQVLDGIVRYGDELLIVIETKLDGPVATGQAQNLNLHGAHVRFDGGVQTVSWREILAAWSKLIETDVVAIAERAVISDFLYFVDQYFPQLGPFATLAQCKSHGFLVNRRLKAILDTISGGPTTKEYLELHDCSTVSRACLEFDEESQSIQLRVYPADTLTQAKAFYTRPRAVSAVLSLRNRDWEVKPNFHFGFMASGCVWTTADAPLEEYVAYWREQIGSTVAINRNDWEALWSDLVQRRFARDEEKVTFDQYFTATNRNSATPRPGLRCFYSWKLSDAKRLDDRNLLVSAVAGQLNVVLQALGETRLESGLP